MHGLPKSTTLIVGFCLAVVAGFLAVPPTRQAVLGLMQGRVPFLDAQRLLKADTLPHHPAGDSILSKTPLDAASLNGHPGLYYLDAGNLTGTIANARFSAYANLESEHKITPGSTILTDQSLSDSPTLVHLPKGTITGIQTGLGLTGGGATGNATISLVPGIGLYLSQDGTLNALLGDSVDLVSETVNVLPINRGGTGLSVAPVAGQILLGTNAGYTLASLTAGDGATVSTTGGAVTIGLDTSVCRTSGNCTGAGGSITGSGTANHLAKFTGSGAVVDSLVYDDGQHVGLGTSTPGAMLSVATAVPVVTGSELITNGDFATDAQGWTLGDCASYSAAHLTVNYDGVCSTPDVTTTVATQAGHTYQLSFTLTVSGDQAYEFFGQNQDGYDIGPFGSGHYTVLVRTDFTGNDTLDFENWNWNAGSSWTLDDVTMQEVDPLTPTVAITGWDGTTWLSLGDDTIGNTALGQAALQMGGSGGANSAFGSHALALTTTGSSNTAVGAKTLASNTTGYSNTAVGSRALMFNTTGGSNTAVGIDALLANTTGFVNTAIGQSALSSNTAGLGNTAIGSDAMFWNTTGKYNSALGTNTLVANVTGMYNVGLGSQAGANNKTGNSNVFLGYQAGYNELGQGNCIWTHLPAHRFISPIWLRLTAHPVPRIAKIRMPADGARAGQDVAEATIRSQMQLPCELGSNKLYIANSQTASPLIYGDFSQNRLGIASNTLTAALNFAASTANTGGISFGTDTNLYRAATNSLTTDGLFTAGSGIAIGSGGTPIKKHLSTTTTWDPPSIATGTATSTTLALSGAAAGDVVTVGFSQPFPDGVLISGSVSAANTVKVTIGNLSGSVVDLASGTLRVAVSQY